MSTTDFVRGQLEQFGLNEFLGGRAYGPERILQLFSQSYGGPQPTAIREQRVAAPGISEALRYGTAASDLASRGSAIQTGVAGESLTGLSPAARAAALARVGEASGANIAGAGAAGFGQGLEVLQRAALANQSANLQAQQSNLQSILTQMGLAQDLFSGSMNRALEAGRMGLTYDEEVRRRKAEERAREREFWGNLAGSAAGAAGAAYGNR